MHRPTMKTMKRPLSEISIAVALFSFLFVSGADAQKSGKNENGIRLLPYHSRVGVFASITPARLSSIVK